MFQLDFMLDLQITHVINPCEQEIRFDPTKYAKQGICYKGFICKVSGVGVAGVFRVFRVVLTLGHAWSKHLSAPRGVRRLHRPSSVHEVNSITDYSLFSIFIFKVWDGLHCLLLG